MTEAEKREQLYNNLLTSSRKLAKLTKNLATAWENLSRKQVAGAYDALMQEMTIHACLFDELTDLDEDLL